MVRRQRDLLVERVREYSMQVCRLLADSHISLNVDTDYSLCIKWCRKPVRPW